MGALEPEESAERQSRYRVPAVDKALDILELLSMEASGLTMAVLAPFSVGFLRDYVVLISSLTAYGVSAIVCVAVSLRSSERFDFDLLNERVVAFQGEQT